MNARKIVAVLLLLIGEALLILVFLHFGRNESADLMRLNIGVASIIYLLLFFEHGFPWINLKDKTQKAIGAIGLRWFFTGLYILLAIVAMVTFNQDKSIQVSNQVIVHAVLFFLLILGLFVAYSSGEKVSEIYHEEKQNRAGIEEMKKATKRLQLKLDALSSMPDEFTRRINELQENLRFLSPCNDSNASELEAQYIQKINELSQHFSEIPLNNEKIVMFIKDCERTYKERKQIFSQ